MSIRPESTLFACPCTLDGTLSTIVELAIFILGSVEPHGMSLERRKLLRDFLKL